jgi:hypothetical protein
MTRDAQAYGLGWRVGILRTKDTHLLVPRARPVSTGTQPARERHSNRFAHFGLRATAGPAARAGWRVAARLLFRMLELCAAGRVFPLNDFFAILLLVLLGGVAAPTT